MINQSYDYETLDEVVKDFKEEWVDWDAESLVASPNVLLSDGEKNFALFQYQSPGVYNGHYLFTARGLKDTHAVARELLTFFLTNYRVDVIIGYTPVENKGALWLNRRLGFTEHSVVDTEAGPHLEVSLNKDDFHG